MGLASHTHGPTEAVSSRLPSSTTITSNARVQVVDDGVEMGKNAGCFVMRRNDDG